MIYLILRNNFYECIPSLVSAFKKQTLKPRDYLMISLLYKLIDEKEFPKKKQTLVYSYFEKNPAKEKKSAVLVNAYEITSLAGEYYIFKMQGK